MLYYVTYTHIPTKKAFGYAIAKMCSSFAEHVPVTLIIPKSAKREIDEDIYTYYNISPNFTVKELACLDLFRFKFLGKTIPFLIRKVTFAVSAFFSIRFSADDLCYSRDIWSMFLLRMKTDNVFLEIHYLSRVDALSVRFVHSAKKIVVITSHLKKELAELGYAPDDILIIPSGIDMAEFEKVKENKQELRKKLGLPGDKKIILYSGNLFKWKGVYTLVDAFEMLHKELHDTVRLVIVGGSDDALPEFEAYVASKQSAPAILVTGHKKHEEVASYLKSADVLVLPNSASEKISTHNTSPLKLFEYMASGVPIVASDLPSMREILDEESCVFAQPDNAASFAGANKTVFADTATSWARATKARVAAGAYDWKKRAEAVLAFIG